jgi:hypothetical protein
LYKIKVIKDIKLISKPNQEFIHELDEIVIIDPNNIINKNNSFDKLIKIKKKRYFLYR